MVVNEAIEKGKIMTYLKVYYYQDKTATKEDVERELPKDIPGLTVDNDLGYPCVEFTTTYTLEIYNRVRQTLQQAGFETE